MQAPDGPVMLSFFGIPVCRCFAHRCSWCSRDCAWATQLLLALTS